MHIIPPLLGFMTVLAIFFSESPPCYVNANSLEVGGSSLGMTSNAKWRRSSIKNVRRNPSFTHASLEERADPNGPKPDPTATSSTSAVPTPSTNKKNSNSASDQTEQPISMVTIVALIAGGGVVTVMIIIFAIMRKRRLKRMTDRAVTKALEQQSDLYIEMKDNEPRTYTIIATYAQSMPSMDDELDIQLGDKVTILAEYDDGWVQGVNETRGGIKGTFPKHCVNMDNPLNYKRSSSVN